MEERIIKDINNLLAQLFQKMKEAGYEWDAEKKELNKKSQRMISAEAKEALYGKPVWSEDDEEMLTEIITDVKFAQERNPQSQMNQIIFEEETNWLKSLKDRITWKPSDKQMKALHDLNLNISYAGQRQVLIELYNDLKKLK